MITSTAVKSSALSTAGAYAVYYSTDTGASGGTDQESAITTLVLCNTGTPDLTDVTVRSATVNVWLARKTGSMSSPNAENLVISNLTIPAGETVFFSEERIILAGGDKVYIASTSGGTETTGAFITGANYTISNVGDTDFTLIGAASNTVGVSFNATGAGGGTTGTATRNLVSVTVSSLAV